MDGIRRWLPSWWDAATASCVATVVVVNATAGWTTPRVSVLAVALGLVSAAALLARSRLPVATLLVVFVCAILPTVIGGTYPDFYGSFVPTLVAFYAVALSCPVREAAMVPVLGVAVLVTFALRVPAFLTVNEAVYIVTGGALAFAAGRTMRVLRRRAEIETARADLLEREQHVQAREAVLAERERISRELHDVIAHDVAVMVVQAGAAERLLPDRSGDVGETLSQIQSSGRKAIEELHLLLGMLRDDDQALITAPGLQALDPLVRELKRIGLPVTLDVTGSVRELGDALELSAYRIVQEALTNVLKHAHGSHTNVLVDYGCDALTIAVADDGDGRLDSPAMALASSGQGLVGMRERVRIFGGQLAAGARTAGGWEVTAVLPIPVGAT